MVKKSIIKEIDRVIKETWLKDIKKDYNEGWLWKEYALQNCLFFHLRRRLSSLLKENNLRIIPEYTFPEIKQRADIAFIEIDPEEPYGEPISIPVIFELKYTCGTDNATTDWVMRDIRKFKRYYQEAGLKDTLFYFAVIYEAERLEYDNIKWITDRRVSNGWASGRVAELDAGLVNDKMKFGINSFNGLNLSL